MVDDLRGELGRDDLAAWFAPGRFGKTLVTTRSRGYGGHGRGRGAAGGDGVRSFAEYRTSQRDADTWHTPADTGRRDHAPLSCTRSPHHPQPAPTAAA